jgi:hypothetical protein
MLLVGLVPAVLFARDRVRVIVMNGFPALLAIGTAAGWLAANSELMLIRAPCADAHAQAALLVSQPVAFLSILSTNLLRDALHHYVGLVGVIGWSTTSLPPITYALALVGMILAIFIRRPEDPDIPRLAGAWQLLIVAGGVVLIEIALYLTWNPVGSRFIGGVQGRYFLPLLGVFVIALRTLLRLPQDEGRSRCLGAIVLALVAVQILALDATIVSAYSVF